MDITWKSHTLCENGAPEVHWVVAYVVHDNTDHMNSMCNINE